MSPHISPGNWSIHEEEESMKRRSIYMDCHVFSFVVGCIWTQNENLFSQSTSFHLPTQRKEILGPRNEECLCVLQTPALSNDAAAIITISLCPSGGVETSVIYRHNDCIYLSGNVLS